MKKDVYDKKRIISAICFAVLATDVIIRFNYYSLVKTSKIGWITIGIETIVIIVCYYIVLFAKANNGFLLFSKEKTDIFLRKKYMLISLCKSLLRFS